MGTVNLACGCIVTTARGHVHTKLCPDHVREIFVDKREKTVQTPANAIEPDFLNID